MGRDNAIDRQIVASSAVTTRSYPILRLLHRQCKIGAHVVYNAMSREKYYTSGASGKYGYELYAEVAVS
ncbi:hypothetical protein KEM48_013396 [Puccinia striiformis f. sp. tritici PST-130]|nr:hypothetical protein KEM48_013396 [Puccinia striiformis f. sp. tritici PST-130]